MRTVGRLAVALIALALLISAACESPTPVAPAESGLSISANPTRIGVKESADITVIARKADGSAVNEGTEVNFSTSLGSISPLVALTNDRGVASAILKGDGTVGTATVEASSGAAAPVTLDIQVGSLPASMTLQASPPRIPKDGGETALVANVLDDLGNTITDAAVRFTSEAGTLDSGGSSILTNDAGDAEDTLTLTSFDVGGVNEGFFLVTAETIGVDNLPLTAEIELEVGGFVQNVILTPSPGTISRTDSEIVLNALVLDDGGDTVAGAGVVFGSDTGTLQSAGRQVPSDSEGVATDVLFVTPTDLDGLADGVNSFQVEASVPGLGGDLIVGEATIRISTSAGLLVLEANPDSIICETAENIDLIAEVREADNSPAEGVNVNFQITSSPPAGVITDANVNTDMDGIAITTLTISATEISCTEPISPSLIVVEASSQILGEPVEGDTSIIVNPQP